MRLIKKTIAECLRSRVRESADRVALEADEQRYTWKDLDTLSDYMVGRMLSCGIRKGTHVGIWSTNSPNWIIVFLALSKIGAVPVLLNTCYRSWSRCFVTRMWSSCIMGKATKNWCTRIW